MGKHAVVYQPETVEWNPDTEPVPVVPAVPTEELEYDTLIHRVETTTIWKDLVFLIGRVKKFIVALIGAAVVAAETLPSTTELPTRANWQEYIPAVTAFLTALGVLGFKNKEKE